MFVNSYMREIINISHYAAILDDLDKDEEKWTYEYPMYLESVDILWHVESMCRSMKRHYFHNPYDTLVSLGIFRAAEGKSSTRLGTAIENAEKYIDKFQEQVPDRLKEEYSLQKWAEFKEELKNETEIK